MPSAMMSIQAILCQSLWTVESLDLPAGEAASGKKLLAPSAWYTLWPPFRPSNGSLLA